MDWQPKAPPDRKFELVAVRDVYEDLLVRTLARIPSLLARLIFLASTRDYNSGAYSHEGLAARFSPETAARALWLAHSDVFYQVTACSLEELVHELEIYAESSRLDIQEIIRTWQALEPYGVAIPMHTNSTVARLFKSNIRLALAILRFRCLPAPEGRPAASPLP